MIKPSNLYDMLHFKQKFIINHKNKNYYYFCIDILIYQAYNKNIQKDEEEWHYGYF